MKEDSPHANLSLSVCDSRKKKIFAHDLLTTMNHLIHLIGGPLKYVKEDIYSTLLMIPLFSVES